MFKDLLTQLKRIADALELISAPYRAMKEADEAPEKRPLSEKVVDLVTFAARRAREGPVQVGSVTDEALWRAEQAEKAASPTNPSNFLPPELALQALEEGHMPVLTPGEGLPATVAGADGARFVTIFTSNAEKTPLHD